MSVSTLNQFEPDVLPGQIALTAGHHHNILNVMLMPTALTTYAGVSAGYAVSWQQGESLTPLVKNAMENASDAQIGVALVSQKKDDYVSGDMLEIATNNTDIYVLASGAISRGDNVYSASQGTVSKAGSGNPVLGVALDDAADGQVFRIRVRGI